MLPNVFVGVADAATLAGVLGDVTSAVTSALSWVGSVGSTITDTPILLVGVILTFVGFGVGLFKRMLHV